MTAAVVWLRRNLRLDDNAALSAALRHADAVVPVFVLDDGVPGDDSPPRQAVLADSLGELAAALRDRGSRLVVRKGPPADSLVALCRETGADAVFTHRDHEPHAKERETRSTHLARGGRRAPPSRRGPPSRPGRLPDVGGRKAVHRLHAVRPSLARARQGAAAPGAGRDPDAGRRPRPVLPLDSPLEALVDSCETGAPENPKGGAREARLLWDTFRSGALKRYAGERDRPDLPGTSRLSPHLRFGTIGVRRLLSEARAAFREDGRRGKAVGRERS